MTERNTNDAVSIATPNTSTTSSIASEEGCNLYQQLDIGGMTKNTSSIRSRGNECDQVQQFMEQDAFYVVKMSKTVYMFKESKLLIMTNAKTASSTMRDLSIEISSNYPSFQIHYGDTLGEPEVMQIVHDVCAPIDEWQRVMFVRDPLERLLSGYLDKCTSATHGFQGTKPSGFQLWDWHQACFEFFEQMAPRYHMADAVEFAQSAQNNFNAFLEWLQSRRDAGEYINEHYQLFTDRTELLLRMDRWLYVDIKQRNLWIWILQQIFPAHSKYALDTAFIEGLRREFGLFCLEEVGGNAERGVKDSKTDAAQKALKVYDKSSVYRALLYTMEDYLTFRFPLPEWLCFVEELNKTFIQGHFDKTNLPFCFQ